MSQRLDEFNKKYIYTDTNPENIIAGKKNALFFRRGDNFYFNADGNIDGHWEKLNYRTVIIPPPVLTKLIRFKTPNEVWLKTTDGTYNEFEQLMPKVGWKLISYDDIFVRATAGKRYNWIFPPPINTDDPIGNNNSRSYDDNYFYAKISGKWYRTPISIFDSPEAQGPDQPGLTSGLPFVDAPRYLPVPANTPYPGIVGEQSYDIDYFYIKPSLWRRSHLLVYSGTNKMAKF